MSIDSCDEEVTTSQSDAIIQNGLSYSRLLPYLRTVDGDLGRALDLYEWNSRMAAECFFAIGHVEVFLRNALDQALAEHFEEKGRGIPWFLQIGTFLSEEDKRIIDKARKRLQLNQRPDSRDRIVAQLSFGFWSRLIGREHEDLWRAATHKAFTDPKTGASPTRKRVSLLTERLRLARNRAAHHNYMNSFDVPQAMKDVLELAGLLSPNYATWIEQRSQWRETYENCPKIDDDTVVIAAGQGAWELYQEHPIYVCRAGRYFRPVTHMAFYEGRVIHRQVPQILRRLPSVAWSEATAATFESSNERELKKLAAAIAWSLSSDGQERAREWGIVDGEEYQVFILTSPSESPSRNDGHMLLGSDIPHLISGRGSAFTQKQRYVSRHRLGSATSTDDLNDFGVSKATQIS